MPAEKTESLRAGGLSVLMPTLDCKGLLSAQLAGLRTCFDLVDEILVVDSHSTDGTVEYIRENLPHPRLRVVSHPRGLYESWNAGIRQLSSEYVHIATAGDTITRDGMEHLLGQIRRFDADIVLSPPRFSGAETEDWPIHGLVARQTEEARLLDEEEKMDWTFRWGASHCGVLGSSASNLYRRSLLVDRPFPVDAGACGDVAWGLRHMHRAKVVVTRRKCAEFVIHPKPDRPYEHIGRALFVHACAGVADARPDLAGVLGPLVEFPHWVLARNAADRSLQGLPFPGSWLSRTAWRLRFARATARRKLAAMGVERQPWPSYFRDYLGRFLDGDESIYFKCARDA